MFEIIAALAGYLSGSLSLANAVGRWRGIDLRKSGSGNLGTSNVREHFGAKWAALVFVGDFMKCTLPASVALLLASRSAAAAAAIGAIIGHNWSAYLRLTGGRGLVCAAAGMLVLSPEIALPCTAIMLCGYPVHQPAPSTVAAVILAPILAFSLHEDGPTTTLALSTCVVVFLKRLHANGTSMPAGSTVWQVMVLRLLFDRDIYDNRAWLDRRSPPEVQR